MPILSASSYLTARCGPAGRTIHGGSRLVGEKGTLIATIDHSLLVA